MTEQMKETIQMIEEEGFNAGELLYEDLKDLICAMGNERDTKSHCEYVRDFLTYIINKEGHWGEDN